MYYDLIDDWPEIVSSFQTQYGIRLKHEDLDLDEFYYYLSNLNENTSLVKLCQIRSENDPERLKLFTPQMKRIRQEWIDKKYNEKTEEQRNKELRADYEELRKMLKSVGEVY